jgi:hypothetical protein
MQANAPPQPRALLFVGERITRAFSNVNDSLRPTQRKIILALLAATLVGISSAHSGASESNRTKYVVKVKDRQTPVDLGNPTFEYVDTFRTSVIVGAWYDRSNSYMIIGLQGTYYQHCRVPQTVWESFRSADSFGKYYNTHIREKYDCRLGGVPPYNDQKGK